MASTTAPGYRAAQRKAQGMGNVVAWPGAPLGNGRRSAGNGATVATVHILPAVRIDRAAAWQDMPSDGAPPDIETTDNAAD